VTGAALAIIISSIIAVPQNALIIGAPARRSVVAHGCRPIEHIEHKVTSMWLDVGSRPAAVMAD
jgi:hypothetical protein